MESRFLYVENISWYFRRPIQSIDGLHLQQ